MLIVDRSASPYAGLRSASVRESSDKRNNQHQLKLHAKPSKHPLPPPRSGFVQHMKLQLLTFLDSRHLLQDGIERHRLHFLQSLLHPPLLDNRLAQ